METGTSQLAVAARSSRWGSIVVLVAVVWAAVPAPAGSLAPGARFAALRSAGSAEASTNWAGYAAVGPTSAAALSFTSVTGTWTQPAASCTPSDTAASSAIWVGLGGYDLSSHALEQIGTDADCDSSGSPLSYAWYEAVPAPRVTLGIRIRPGDVITATVIARSDGVVLRLDDRTRHTHAGTRLSASGADLTSAEWIAEAPSLCTNTVCRPLPLANFGTVTFSRITAATSSGAGTLIAPGWSAVPLQLVPRPGAEATSTPGLNAAGTTAPELRSNDGSSFAVSWLAPAGGP